MSHQRELVAIPSSQFNHKIHDSIAANHVGTCVSIRMALTCKFDFFTNAFKVAKSVLMTTLQNRSGFNCLLIPLTIIKRNRHSFKKCVHRVTDRKQLRNPLKKKQIPLASWANTLLLNRLKLRVASENQSKSYFFYFIKSIKVLMKRSVQSVRYLIAAISRSTTQKPLRNKKDLIRYVRR